LKARNSFQNISFLSYLMGS